MFDSQSSCLPAQSVYHVTDLYESSGLSILHKYSFWIEVILLILNSLRVVSMICIEFSSSSSSEQVSIFCIKLTDEPNIIQRNMKKPLVFCFSKICSLVLNTKKMCLDLWKLFLEEGGFDVVFKKHIHLLQHFVLGTCRYSCFCILFWLDLFTTQVRNYFLCKLATV